MNSLRAGALYCCGALVLPGLLAGCGSHPPDLLALGEAETNAEGEVVTLSLRGDNITDASLQQLRDFNNLGEVSLQECSRISDRALSVLSEVPALTKLNFIRVPITDAGLRHLSDVPALRELLLAHTAVTGSGLPHLQGLPLTHLELHSHRMESGELEAISTLESLQVLELHCSTVTIADLPQLSGLTQLEELVAFQTPLGDGGIERVRNSQRLKRLVIDVTGLGDSAIDVLNTLPNLEELSLANAAVTGTGLQHLSLPKLRKLSLEGCKNVTNDTLQWLGGLPQLEEVNLCDSAVTGTDLTGLKTVPALRKVELTGEQFKGTNESIDSLKQLLPNCEVVVLRS